MRSFTVEIVHAGWCSPEFEAALFPKQVQWHLFMSLSFGYPHCLSPDSHWDSLPACSSGFGDHCEWWPSLLDLASFQDSADSGFLLSLTNLSALAPPLQNRLWDSAPSPQWGPLPKTLARGKKIPDKSIEKTKVFYLQSFSSDSKF